MKTKKLERKLVLNKTTITTMPLEMMDEAKGGLSGDGCVRTGPSYCYETCDMSDCFFTDYFRCTRNYLCPI